MAIAAPLPGERERPCEIITPPLDSDHTERIERLLAMARAARFSVPLEGATHIHFDAGPLCQANTIANLVNTLDARGPRLRLLCATPTHFRRVGGWPQTLGACVNSADFRLLDWPAAVARLRALGLSKYTDFNLKNIAYERADRHTFEARIFPACTEATPVVAAAALIEAVLRHCQRATVIGPTAATPWDCEEMLAWLGELPLDRAASAYWRERAARIRAA